MRKTAFSWLVIAVISVSGCQKSGSESQPLGSTPASQDTPVEFDLDKIIERGSLRAIVDNSSTSYFLYKGQPMGYEYELLQLLAKELGVELDLIVTASINEAFKKLNNGEGDIIAYTLTVTKERKKKVNFTSSHYTVRQVLVQRKPDGWRDLKKHEIENMLIRNQVDLIGKEVRVRQSSSFLDRLQNLSEEIGGDILIVEDTEDSETEALIKKVATGEIDYTVADEDIAMVTANYYRDIDISTPVSFPQQIAWAVRKNSPMLLQTTNEWIAKMKRGPIYNYTYNKYYRNPRATLNRVTSDYTSFTGNKLSPYDDLIQQLADSIQWDWRLLAAQIYQESRFDPKAKSWAGAMGLMQLISATAKRFGTTDVYDPVQSLKGGVNYLRYLDNIWAQSISDEEERRKFVLASYNVGPGHVIDARALAEKYGRDPNVWDDNVEYYVLNKSKPKFFNDPVVKSGYCRGEEPVNYVRQILIRYEQYLELLAS